MWSNWKPYALLVGMWDGAAAVANRTEVPQKLTGDYLLVQHPCFWGLHPKNRKQGLKE